MLYMCVPEDDKICVMEDYQGDGSHEGVMATRAGGFLAGIPIRPGDRHRDGVPARIFTDEPHLEARLHGRQETPEFMTI